MSIIFWLDKQTYGDIMSRVAENAAVQSADAADLKSAG